MNCLVFLSMLALVAVSTAQHNHSCVDLRDVEPCKDFTDDFHNLCDGHLCKLGYFGHCRNGQFKIKPCELTEDTQGIKSRLFFDSKTKTCVAQSSSCLAE